MDVCTVCDTKANLKPCSCCKTAKYCSRKCQKIAWKKHHSITNSTVNSTICVELNTYYRVGIKESKNKLMAVGLNTCMFVVIFTNNSIFGWHYNNKHIEDYIIINYLNHIEKHNLFRAGYIIPGSDRKNDLSLSETSTSVILNPYLNVDRFRSRDYLLNILKKYSFFNRIIIKEPLIKNSIFVLAKINQSNRNRNKYEIKMWEDPAMWQGGCVFDADNIEECEKK
jgi:hypothetical protein